MANNRRDGVIHLTAKKEETKIKFRKKNFSENSFLQKKICVNEVKKRFKVKLKLTCGEDELETSSINFCNLMPFKLLKDAF